jgi:hypothetical protein
MMRTRAENETFQKNMKRIYLQLLIVSRKKIGIRSKMETRPRRFGLQPPEVLQSRARLML